MQKINSRRNSKQDLSGFSINFQNHFKKFSENFQETFGEFPGNFQEASRQFWGKFKKSFVKYILCKIHLQIPAKV